MNRKGDWVQIFLVMFFFFLVIVALSLLFIENGKMETTSPLLTSDFVNLHVDTVLLTTLRLPVQGVDINGDGQPDSVTVAEALVLNNKEYESNIKSTLTAAMPKNVSYRLQAGNYKLEQLYPADDLYYHGIFAMIILPGDTIVNFKYADEKTRAYTGEKREEKRLEEQERDPMGGYWDVSLEDIE